MKKYFVISFIALLSLDSCNSDKSAHNPVADTVTADSASPVSDAAPILQQDNDQAIVRNTEATANVTVMQREAGDQQRETREKGAYAMAGKSEQRGEGEADDASIGTNVASAFQSEIMTHIKQLDERANQLMVRFEVLRDRIQLAQQEGMHITPDEECELTNTIEELIDIRNEQIALSKKLGNEQMEHEYFDKAGTLYATKNQLLNNLQK